MSDENIYYLIVIGATLLTAVVLTFILRKLMNLFIGRSAKRLKTDPTNFSFIKNSVGFLIYSAAVVFIFLTIPPLKSIGTALFAGAGVLALLVGFASQKAFSNIISGVFILIFKPFHLGATIEFKDGHKGIVEEITLRHTIIVNYENRRIIIPNSIISEETIINSSIQDEKICKHVIFSISYESDSDLAIKIIQEEAEKHPDLLDNRSPDKKANGEPKVTVRMVKLNEYSVDLKAYLWAESNDKAFALETDLLKAVKKRFDAAGIEIPYPHRTIVNKKVKS
jgi:small conductance mechanosensitive channel